MSLEPFSIILLLIMFVACSVIVATNRENKYAGQRLGFVRSIEEAGGIVLEGVCFYILDSVARMRTENGWNNLITNSAKLPDTPSKGRTSTTKFSSSSL